MPNSFSNISSNNPLLARLNEQASDRNNNQTDNQNKNQDNNGDNNRANKRANNEMRKISVIRNFTPHAAGSVLMSFGNTQVICTASLSERVPEFRRLSKAGWLTAEYSMLPSSTHQRCERESVKGKQNGRTQEIQRLIGRTLRAAIDLEKLGARTIHIDCDVISADGGTRTASITGAYIALCDAINSLIIDQKISESPLQSKRIAAVSVGIVDGQALLDLDYSEDSHAHCDVNVVMNETYDLIEVQGTAERKYFSVTELNTMLDLAKLGIQQIFNTPF